MAGSQLLVVLWKLKAAPVCLVLRGASLLELLQGGKLLSLFKVACVALRGRGALNAWTRV